MDCHTCAQESDLATAPFSERLYVDEHWRVAHAFNSALPGWLVVLPRRHITTMAELTRAEAVGLGPLLRDLSVAMSDALRCEKTYVAQFAEAEGFAHTHLHVVPRMPDLPTEHRGPRVFHYLDRPRAEWLTVEARDEVSARIARRLCDSAG